MTFSVINKKLAFQTRSSAGGFTFVDGLPFSARATDFRWHIQVMQALPIYKGQRRTIFLLSCVGLLIFSSCTRIIRDDRLKGEVTPFRV